MVYHNTAQNEIDDQGQPVRLSSETDVVYGSTILIIVMLCIWIALVIWGFLSYRWMSKAGTAPKGAEIGSLVGAIMGIFLPILEAVPISLYFVYK